MGLPEASDRPAGDAVRPTPIGPFNVTTREGGRIRQVPAPWVDCHACSWRHYPSTSGGAWHIATVCAACGAPLAVPAG